MTNMNYCTTKKKRLVSTQIPHLMKGKQKQEMGVITVRVITVLSIKFLGHHANESTDGLNHRYQRHE